jgi:23S rRNA (cytosine1962-C5)-methyltransferase
MTDFGHVGVFPEHAKFWPWLKKRAPGLNVLNLFAYSGCASIALAAGGAKVCHLDASKGMVDWAKENAKLNALDEKAIRWIIDDALKFLLREEKRGSKYDGIILDPPTFGRGPQGEVFKVEEKIHPLLEQCRAVLSDRPHFVLFSTHTPGWTPKVMEELMKEYFFNSKIESGEMLIGERLPSGAYALGDFI